MNPTIVRDGVDAPTLSRTQTPRSPHAAHARPRSAPVNRAAEPRLAPTPYFHGATGHLPPVGVAGGSGP